METKTKGCAHVGLR